MGVGPYYSNRKRNMGLSPISSSRSDDNYSPAVTQSVNPDPERFEVMKHQQIGDFLLLMVKYPNCTNYEGKKILVYYKIDLGKMLSQRSLDPHFCNNAKVVSPVARFEPTDRGWKMAELLCSAWKEDKK